MTISKLYVSTKENGAFSLLWRLLKYFPHFFLIFYLFSMSSISLIILSLLNLLDWKVNSQSMWCFSWMSKTATSNYWQIYSRARSHWQAYQISIFFFSTKAESKTLWVVLFATDPWLIHNMLVKSIGVRPKDLLVSSDPCNKVIAHSTFSTKFS